MGFVDPHLLQLGRARPGVAGGGSDHLTGFVVDDKADSFSVVAARGGAVVAIEAVFDGVDLVG